MNSIIKSGPPMGRGVIGGRPPLEKEVVPREKGVLQEGALVADSAAVLDRGANDVSQGSKFVWG
jgi:hypothetical protein